MSRALFHAGRIPAAGAVAIYCACTGEVSAAPCPSCAARDAQPLRCWGLSRPSGLLRAGHIRGRAFRLYQRAARQGRAQVAAAAFRIFRQADDRLNSAPLFRRDGLRALSRPLPGVAR